jgi:hypothetical protein
VHAYKKVSIGDHTVLYHLGQSRSELSRGKRLQGMGVNYYRARLMECAHEIFASRKVDSGLPADACVYLGQKGCRNLNEVDSAQIGRRHESSQVSQHAAANGHQ